MNSVCSHRSPTPFLALVCPCVTASNPFPRKELPLSPAVLGLGSKEFIAPRPQAHTPTIKGKPTKQSKPTFRTSQARVAVELIQIPYRLDLRVAVILLFAMRTSHVSTLRDPHFCTIGFICIFYTSHALIELDCSSQHRAGGYNHLKTKDTLTTLGSTHTPCLYQSQQSSQASIGCSRFSNNCKVRVSSQHETQIASRVTRNTECATTRQ